MLSGDLVHVGRTSIHIHPKSVQSIGLYEESVCWGVWVPNPRGPEELPEELKEPPHLLISGIHPRYWSFLLRCEVKIRDRSGSMAKAASVITESALNIQFGEFTPSGHSHETWTVVVEATDVRAEFHQRLEGIWGLPSKERTLENEDVRAVGDALAEAMFAKGVALEDRLLNKHDEEATKDKAADPKAIDVGFLHNRIVTGWPMLYRPDQMGKGIRSRAQEQAPRAVTTLWLQNLAFFSIYGETPSDPLPFKYDVSSFRLICTARDDLQTLLNRKGYPEGTSAAIATVDSTEHYLRAVPLDPDRVDDTAVHVDCSYDATFDPGTEAGSTLGLWHGVCQSAADRAVNILKMSNHTTHRGSDAEKGGLRFVGVFNKRFSKSDAATFEKAIKGLVLPGVLELELKPRVRRLEQRPVFLSWRVSTNRRGDVYKGVESAMQDWGMRLVTVDDPIGQELQGVVNKGIKECAGMLQVICLSDEEMFEIKRADEAPGKTLLSPKLAWLWYEYGVANGLGIPVARVVNTGLWDVEEWKKHLPVAQGVFLGSFKLGNQDDIDNGLQIALRRLWELMTGRGAT